MDKSIRENIRAFQSSDLAGVVGALREAMSAEAISTAKFVRQVLLDHNFRKEGLIVAEVDGRVVGCCLAIARQMPLENAPSDAERGYITLLGVSPAHRRQGVGARLLAAAEDFLRAQRRAVVMISSYAPGYFIPGVDVLTYASGLEFLKSHGYAEVYRPLAMQTALWNLVVPQWVIDRRKSLEAAGCAIESYHAPLTLPLLEFAREEFPGDWVRVVRETMVRILAGDSPGRLIVAVENGAIVGFSHYDNERFGPIGVAKSQRGRGVGQVLMYATLQAQREAGFRSAWFLWSDDPTADRIYRSAGFVETRRFALMKKPL